MGNPAARLERAQRLLSAGRPARALRSLGRLPAALAYEGGFLRAEALRAQGYFTRASALYERLLQHPQANDPALWIDAALGVASVYRSLGEVGRARARLSAAWRLARRRGAGSDERFALEDALIDRAAGRWKLSLSKLSRLLAGARAGRDWAAAAFLLWATGGARRFSGDLAGSERDFRQSLRLATRAVDPAGQAYALFGLGGVTRIRGRLKSAERFYTEAARRLAATDDLFGKAYAHCGLANALRQQGRLCVARSHYLKAHALYSSLGDAVDLAYVDWGLGKIALQQGELREAARRLKLALSAFEAAQEHRGAALSKLALASTLHARGATSRAERLFDAGLRQSRRAGLHAHLESFT